MLRNVSPVHLQWDNLKSGQSQDQAPKRTIMGGQAKFVHAPNGTDPGALSAKAIT